MVCRERHGVGIKTHTARGSENTSLWMCSIRSPPAEYSITKHTCSGVWKQPKRFTRKGCPALVTAAKIRFSHIKLGRRQKSESPAALPYTRALQGSLKLSVKLHCSATLSNWIHFSFWEMGKESEPMLVTAWEPAGLLIRPGVRTKAWGVIGDGDASLSVRGTRLQQLQWHQASGQRRLKTDATGLLQPRLINKFLLI